MSKAEICSLRVLGSDNGVARIVGFMDFREEIESGSNLTLHR